MKKTVLFFYLITLLISHNVFSQSVKCGDLFMQYGEKPKELEFIACKEGEGQLIVEARYRVAGKEADKVEQYLIKKYGLGKLKFYCCAGNLKMEKMDRLKMLN